jgi:transcriptional regulator with XRE-family HTH domain
MHKIAGWIDDHDLTLEEMADRVGVKPSTLIKWLRGYPVKRQYLKRIAAVIGCTVEDLLNDGAI